MDPVTVTGDLSPSRIDTPYGSAGYEIHQGRTMPMDAADPVGAGRASSSASEGIRALPDALGWCNPRGNVLGIYLHGLFENDAVLAALIGQRAPSAMARAAFRPITTHSSSELLASRLAMYLW